VYKQSEHFVNNSRHLSATEHRVYTVTNQSILMMDEQDLWSYAARSKANPETGLPYMEEDLYMHSRYLGYSMVIKSTAFIPCVVGFIVFVTISSIYGRIQASASIEANKVTEL
jgi:hypothetical protein